jgi:hypothetical protein
MQGEYDAPSPDIHAIHALEWPTDLKSFRNVDCANILVLVRHHPLNQFARFEHILKLRLFPSFAVRAPTVNPQCVVIVSTITKDFVPFTPRAVQNNKRCMRTSEEPTKEILFGVLLGVDSLHRQWSRSRPLLSHVNSLLAFVRNILIIVDKRIHIVVFRELQHAFFIVVKNPLQVRVGPRRLFLLSTF